MGREAASRAREAIWRSTPRPCGPARRCRSRTGWGWGVSYLDVHTPGSRLSVGLAVQPKRAKGGEAPLPRHSFIPARTPAQAARGAPFWGSRSAPAGNGRRHGLGPSGARLPGVHRPGRRPSLAGPALAAALPVTAAATPNPGPLDVPAVSPTWALGSRRHRGWADRAQRKPNRWGQSALCPAHAEGRLWCRVGWPTHPHEGAIAGP